MAGNPKGKQVQICSYYSPEVASELKRLAKKTRIPLAAHLREAAEDLLKKYAGALKAGSGKSKQRSE